MPSVIDSYTFDIRINFKGKTASGMDVHDCVMIPASTLITPTPENVAIIQAAAIPVVTARLAAHEANRLAAIAAQQNAVIPTQEERVAAIAQSIDPADIEALKLYLEGIV